MLNGNPLELAINEAWKYQGLTYPNPAVGCAIENKDGFLLSVETHKKAGQPHAEVEAVKSALQKLNPKLNFPENPIELYKFILARHDNLLQGATVHVTLEPCNHTGKTPPCSALLEQLLVKRVIIGAEDKNKIASGGACRLKNTGIEVIKSELQTECEELLEPFLSWQKGNFSFFKLGMSLNGVIQGGIITSESSRHHAHQLRDVCDLLIIGGNTVRVDRPTLDARMCGGSAPDVLIYSHQKSFDKNIPLFSVPNRKVFIESDFEKMKKYNFIMIEGGQNLLKSLPKSTKWLLIYNSPNMLEGKNITSNLSLKPLWRGNRGIDAYGWYKIV